MTDEKVKDLESKISKIIETIESYPNSQRLYVELYDTALEAIPYLSDKAEKRSLLTYVACGKLGSFDIDYVKKIGIAQASVADMRTLSTNPKFRRYVSDRGMGHICPFSEIWEYDRCEETGGIVHLNEFKD